MCYFLHVVITVPDLMASVPDITSETVTNVTAPNLIANTSYMHKKASLVGDEALDASKSCTP